MLTFILALIGATLLVTLSLAVLEKHALNIEFNPKENIQRTIMRIIPHKSDGKNTGKEQYIRKEDHLEQMVEREMTPDNSSEKYVEKYMTDTTEDNPIAGTDIKDNQDTGKRYSRILSKNSEQAKKITEELDTLIAEFDKEIEEENAPKSTRN